MIFEPQTYEEATRYITSIQPLRIAGSKPIDDSRHVLALHKLDQVLLYEPEEMIVKVQAGMTLRSLNEVLRKRGQWIPTLVAEESTSTTIGGAIATDDHHPRATAAGSLRTAILGATLLAADGTLFKSGSRVVKSVAGYDTHRAFCGSRGKFGAILDVTLKVQPYPEAFLWFRFDSQDLPKLRPFYATVLDAAEQFCELSGYQEDIAHDELELGRANLIRAIIGEEEAHQTIKRIVERYGTSSPPSGQLRDVFDPKGILA